MVSISELPIPAISVFLCLFDVQLQTLLKESTFFNFQNRELKLFLSIFNFFKSLSRSFLWAKWLRSKERCLFSFSGKFSTLTKKCEIKTFLIIHDFLRNQVPQLSQRNFDGSK